MSSWCALLLTLMQCYTELLGTECTGCLLQGLPGCAQSPRTRSRADGTAFSQLPRREAPVQNGR